MIGFDSQLQVYVASAALVILMALFKAPTPSDAPVAPDTAAPNLDETQDTSSQTSSPAPSIPRARRTRADHDRLRRSTALSPPRPIVPSHRAASSRDQAAAQRTNSLQPFPQTAHLTFGRMLPNPPVRAATNRTQPASLPRQPAHPSVLEPRGPPNDATTVTRRPSVPQPQSSRTRQSHSDSDNGARLPHEPLPAVAYRSFRVPGRRRPFAPSVHQNSSQPPTHHAPPQALSAPMPPSRLSRSTGLPPPLSVPVAITPRPIHMRRANAAPAQPTWNDSPPPPPSRVPAHPRGTGFLESINPANTDPATYTDMIARPPHAQREFQRFQTENNIPPSLTWHGRIAAADAREVVRRTEAENEEAALEGRFVDEDARAYTQPDRDWAYWAVTHWRGVELARVRALRKAGLVGDAKRTGRGTRDDPMVIDGEEDKDEGEVVRMEHLDGEGGGDIAEWQQQLADEPPVDPIDVPLLSPTATPTASDELARFARPSPPPEDAWDGTVRRTARASLKRKRSDETEDHTPSDGTSGEDSAEGPRPAKRVRFVAEDAETGKQKDLDLYRYRMDHKDMKDIAAEYAKHKFWKGITDNTLRNSPRCPPRPSEQLEKDKISYRFRSDEELLQDAHVRGYRLWEDRRRVREVNEEIRREGCSTPNGSIPLFTVGWWMPSPGEVPEEVDEPVVDNGEVSSVAGEAGDSEFEPVAEDSTMTAIERHQLGRVRYSMQQRTAARILDTTDESMADPGFWSLPPDAESLNLQRALFNAPAPALPPVLPAETAAAVAFNAANWEMLRRELQEQEEESMYADPEPVAPTVLAGIATTATNDPSPSSPASPSPAVQEDTGSVGEERSGAVTRASERMNEDTHQAAPLVSPRGRSVSSPLLFHAPVSSVLGRRKRSQSPHSECPAKRRRIASPSPEPEPARVPSPQPTVSRPAPIPAATPASEATNQPTKPEQATVVDDSPAQIQPAGSQPAETVAATRSCRRRQGTSATAAPTQPVRRSARNVAAAAAAAAAAAEDTTEQPDPMPRTTARARRGSSAATRAATSGLSDTKTTTSKKRPGRKG